MLDLKNLNLYKSHNQKNVDSNLSDLKYNIILC